MAKGLVYSKVVRKDSFSLEGAMMVRDVVETYVPIMKAGKFLGALEVYFDITADKERQGQLLRQVYFTLALLIAALLAVVVGATFFAGRSLAKRRRAERGLMSLQRMHELILASSGDGILGLDPEGNNTFVNPAAATMLGYEVGELCGKKNHDLVHHSRIDQTPMPLAECPIYLSRAKGETYQVNEDIFWRKDGSSMPVQYISKPIFEDGVLLGGVVTFQSLEERQRVAREKRQLEAQFFHAQKMEPLGVLADGVAHDFNNLLTGIIGFADLAFEEADEDSSLKSDLAEIGTLARQAANLTRQLLVFSRQQPLEPVSLNVNDLVRGVDKMLQRLLGENIELRLNLGDDLTAVKADPGLIEQVIMNLTVNAREAMPDSGQLTVETTLIEVEDPGNLEDQFTIPAGLYVLLSVTDTGVGMDEETQKRIFEPFFTAAGIEGAAAVFAERAAEIDLLLTDLKLPMGTGKELYARLTGEKPTLKVLCAVHVMVCGWFQNRPGYGCCPAGSDCKTIFTG